MPGGGMAASQTLHTRILHELRAVVCAGVHAGSALCSALPAGLALDACTAGRVPVRGHVPDLHEPTVSRLGAHEEVRAACCCGLAAGAALPCHAKGTGITGWLQA